MNSKFTSLQIVLAEIIVLISATFTHAQNLHQDWTRTETGAITNLQNMTVLENGDHYVAEDTRDDTDGHGFNIVKYNDDGGLVWRKPYFEMFNFVEPVATAYNAGAIFVLGNTLSSGQLNVVKFSGDDGSKLDEVLYGGGIRHRHRGIIADPIGTGVIVTSVRRYTDPGPWGERQYKMYTIKFDSDFNEIWPARADEFLGLLGDGTQTLVPTPRTITADSEGNTYITGVSHVEALPAGSPPRICAARAFTMKYNRDGILQGPPLESPADPSITNHGYDNDYDATGTYMVYQSVPTHLVDEPVSTGMTVLTKRNLDGSTWTQRRPSRIRDLDDPDFDGTIVQRDVLAVDRITSSAYIAYDESASASSVVLEKYDAAGVMRWDRRISVGAETRIQSVIIDRSGNVVVGVNDDTHGTYSIFAYDAEGRFRGRSHLITGKLLKHLVVDNHNHIHAIGTIIGSTNSYFVSRFSYEATSRFSSIPELVRAIDNFDVDLFAFDPGECWTGPFINWNCLTPPYCVNPKEMKASLLLDDKTVWESIFTKPINTTFPESKDFRKFSLKVNDGQMFQQVLLVDDKLVKNGVTQLSFTTNSIDESVDLNIKTNGAQIPVTVSLLNAQGKVLWKEQFTAPFQKQLSEKFNEPVASISFNGPEDQISISYYPNPSNGAFTVELDPKQSLPVELGVYDMQGFRVHQQMLKESKAAVNLFGKKPGLYVLQIKNGAKEIRELIQIK